MSKDLTPTEQHNALALLLSDTDRLSQVPVETVERLWAIQQEIDAQRARREFVAAKHAAQSECEPVRKRARNPETRSMYALAEDIDRMLQPIISANGFDVDAWAEPTEHPDTILVKLRVSHTGGHSEIYTFPAPMDHLGPKGGPQKTRIQGSISAMSYAVRVLKCRVFNVELVKDDGDGNKPASAEKISETQAGDLLVLLKDTKADVDKFKEFFAVENVEDLPVSRYREAVQMLERKRTEGQARADR